MKKAILDRLLWLPVESVDVPRLIDDMTLHVHKFIGEPEKLLVYELRGDYVGVPRRWGIKALQDTLLGLEIDDRRTCPTVLWPPLTWPEGGGYRKGQEDAVESIYNALSSDATSGGLLEAGCGGGKTLMGLNVAAKIQTNVLVLVHKSDLAAQWHDTAKMFWPGSLIGHVQQNELTYHGCNLVTASAQTLYSRKDDLPQEFWDSFGMLIIDEGHRYAARTFEGVLRLFNCKFRLGVSATWRRSDKMECIWHYHVGKVEHRADISRLKGMYKQIVWNTGLTDKMFYRGSHLDRSAYITAISEIDSYNEWIVKQMLRSTEVGRRALVITDRVEHCEKLRSMFMLECVKVGRIPDIGWYKRGLSIDQRKRELCKTAILATYGMMSEGTDVEELDTLILATPRRDVEQVIGRIQRPKDGKRELLVVDPVFQTKWCNKLADARKIQYNKLGFTLQP